ncbi:MAG: S8 family serine peptidase [Gemmatimonadota bacterium]|jgi:hypothetical protein
MRARGWLAMAALLGGGAIAVVGAGPGRSARSAWWVFLDPAAATTSLPAAISGEAAAARSRLGLPDLPGDRPVPTTLVRALERTGARARYASRWLRAVSVDADGGALERIRALPFVVRIVPVATVDAADASALPAPPVVPAAAPYQSLDSAFYGPDWPALKELGVPTVHAFGFTGKGVRVAILDGGFEPRHASLSGRQVYRARDFINGDTVVYNQPGDPADQARHGTHVWSLIGGYAPGSLVAPAYDAQFILAKVDAEPGDNQADEDRWVAAVEWADSLGARVIVSAVVFRYDFTDRLPTAFDAMNGDSTVTTRIADAAARRGILFVSSIGNAGPAAGSLSSPADGDSVLAVGATDASGAAATFTSGGASARGPTADGRVKPDVAARGVGIFAASAIALGAYDISLQGTSYPTALVAGAAATFLEAWPELSADAARRALRLAGRRSGPPDDDTGRGIPDVASAILFPDGLSPGSIAPIDLSRALTTVVPTVSWRASLVSQAMRPVHYRVQLATDSLFQNVIRADTITESSAVTLRQALRPAPALWWRVVATAALGVTRTSAAAGPFSMPSWVRLLSPDDDQVSFVDSPRPDLSWVPLAAPPPVGPFVYDVEILSNETGQLVQPALRGVTTATVRVPQPLVPNVAYRWRVIARTQTGVADTVESRLPFVVTSETRPPATLLYQNFPNPFPRADLGASSTRIWFDLADSSSVQLTVLDLRGRRVRRLIPTPGCSAVTLGPGIYGRGLTGEVNDPCILTSWDGRDDEGRTVARGIYLLHFRAAGKEEYRRMVFLPEG